MVNPNRRIDQDHSGFSGRCGAAIKSGSTTQSRQLARTFAFDQSPKRFADQRGFLTETLIRLPITARSMAFEVSSLPPENMHKMTETEEGERNAVQVPAAGSGDSGTLSRSCACPRQMV
jgi:hypothetical protein